MISDFYLISFSFQSISTSPYFSTLSECSTNQPSHQSPLKQADTKSSQLSSFPPPPAKLKVPAAKATPYSSSSVSHEHCSPTHFGMQNLFSFTASSSTTGGNQPGGQRTQSAQMTVLRGGMHSRFSARFAFTVCSSPRRHLQ